MISVQALPFLWDFTVYQGATWRQSFRWRPGGVPIDLSAWTGRMQARSADPAAALWLDLSTGNGGVLLDTDGTITLYAAAAATAELRPGVALRYDLKLTNPGGEVIRWVMGALTVSAQVTVP